VSYYAYGSHKLAKLAPIWRELCQLVDVSDSEVIALGNKSFLSALPLDLLGEIVLHLPCSLYKSARTVSRSWHETLNHECQWERLCRLQWPGVTQITSHSWRKFALQGGGDLLGACLLHHLQNKALASGVQPPAVMTNGAVNHNSKDGWSSLHYACRLGFKDVVSKLLDARAHVELRDDQHGYTPLMVAATHGREEICSLLLKRGASKEPINNYSKTAAHCALSWGHSELSRILWKSA